MEENNNGGYTAEGRKLRPRRSRVPGKVYSSVEGPADRRRTYRSSGERNSGGYEERNYGRRSYGDSEGRGRERSGGRGYGHSDGYERQPDSGRGYGNSGGRSYGRSYGSRSYGNSGPGRGRANSDERRNYGYSGDYGNSDRRSGYGQSDEQGNRNYGRRQFSEGGDSGHAERRRFGPSGRRANFGGFGPSGRNAFAGERDGAPGRGGFKGRKPAGGGRTAQASRPARAKRPAPKPNPYKFSETDERSMDMMLSRKPQLDQIQLSGNDYVETPVKDTVRLNKFIANSGICSRREADQYIQAGVVSVNGEIVTELGVKVNVFSDDIRFNGERIRGEEKVYIVMNKPKAYVTTTSDAHAEKTVMDLLKKCSARVFPVGRLDKGTTGVLMFTNDGEIAERLTHPSYDKKKIYQVILEKPITQEDFDKVLNGVTLCDGDIKADELEYLDPEDHRKLGIEIHSGKNRIVRRIFEFLGYNVKALDRVYFAGLTKKGLKKGEWRYLTEGEVSVLKMGAYA